MKIVILTLSICIVTLLMVIQSMANLNGLRKKVERKRNEKMKFSQVIVWFFLILGFLLIVFSLYAPNYIVNTEKGISKLIVSDDTSTAKTDHFAINGQIGDKYGGLMNPFIAIAGVVFTGLAFYMQFQANNLVSKQFKKQEFDAIFYKLLDIHVQNTNALEIEGQQMGRKLFVRMFEEYKVLFFFCEQHFESNRDTYISHYNIDLNELKLVSRNIAYKLFLHGLGPNSNKLNYELIKEFIFFNEELQSLMKCYNEEYGQKYDIMIKEGKKYPITLMPQDYIDRINIGTLKCYYKPFEGHLNRLSTYYRHLFLIVKHVIKNEQLTVDEQYKYIQIIRAQLTPHEQLMLFLNSTCDYGKEWLKLEIFTKYKLIHNMPLELLADVVEPAQFLLDNANDNGKLKLDEKTGILKYLDKIVFEWNE